MSPLSQLIDALSDEAAYPHAAPGIEVIHTHASVVFLAGEFAYKVKKPVDFGFLDYSSLERRKQMCSAEIELNSRLAADVYLEVVPITETAHGLAVGGSGPVAEYAVKMRRLPDAAQLGSRLKGGTITPALLDALAERIARFHQRSRRGPEISRMAEYEVVERNCLENLTALKAWIGSVLTDEVYHGLHQLTRQELAKQRPRIVERARGGIPCDTHGDLRLEHVYVFLDQPPPKDICIVDCIEFNERFRYSDPVADIAFLAMDMRAHGDKMAAEILLERYFELSDDGNGRALLPLYVAYRAAVRSKVQAIKAMEAEVPEPTRSEALQRARAHVLQAFGELARPDQRPCLIITCGLPGTGKSALSRALALSAGFCVIRSDLTRKQLAGLKPTQSGGTIPEGGIYDSDWTEQTYAACREEAGQALFAGKRVIVDATFRNEHQRLAFVELAGNWCVPMRILFCTAPDDVVRDRLEHRHGDPSDADWGVYQHMQTIWEPFGAVTRRLAEPIDTDAASRQVLQRALQALQKHGIVDPTATNPEGQ